MKLIQLKYFLAVYEANNFTVAANELYVSQPAISRSIRELESEYGISLFKRKNNRLEITDQGEWLAERAKYILDYVDETEQNLYAMSANQGYVRLGVDPMVATSFMFPVINEITQHYPDMRLDISEAGSMQLRLWADSSMVDFAACVTNGLQDDKSQLQILPLTTTELVFCVGKEHPFAKEGKKDVTFEELADQKIVLLKEDSFQNRFIKEKFIAQDANAKVFMYSSQINSILDLLSFGGCGAFLFKEVAERNGLVAIPLKDKVTLDIGLVWNGAHKLDEAELRIKNFIASSFDTRPENDA